MMEPTVDPKVFDVRALLQSTEHSASYVFTTVFCGIEAVEQIVYRGHEIYECRVDPDVKNAKRKTWELKQRYRANADGLLNNQTTWLTMQEVLVCLAPDWPTTTYGESGRIYPLPLDENTPPSRRLEDRHMSRFAGGLLLQVLIDAKWTRERSVHTGVHDEPAAIRHLFAVSRLSINEMSRRICCDHRTLISARSGATRLSATILSNLAWESRKQNQWVLSWLFKRWQRSARYRSHEKGGYR